MTHLVHCTKITTQIVSTQNKYKGLNLQLASHIDSPMEVEQPSW